MPVRTLDEPMHVYRIGDPDGRFRIYSGDGAALAEGRWHKRRQEVIYASEHYGTALLEKLAHYNGILPAGQHFIEITIPQGTSYEVVTKDSLRGWDQRMGRKSRGFGAQWLNEERSAILIVPSYVSREENNVLINPRHPSFVSIKPGRETPVRWDDRLFG